MEIRTIQVPEGIRYLSQWTDFGNHIPDCHFILDKAHTGVGATEYFLSNDENTIVASPRCSLLESKRQKHPEVWFYRDMQDNATTDDGASTVKKAKYEDIKRFNEDTVEYVKTCSENGQIPKIMSTYDSLNHVIDALQSISSDEPDSWTLVIDEFQVIFSDSSFKSLTEMRFLQDSKCFKKAIFLSATPYLKKYMEQMDEFKNLPYLHLEWPPEMQEKAVITNIAMKKGESKNMVAKKIIDRIREGKTIKFGPKEIDTREAVFYINSVKDILGIIKACKLTPAEVNILCSKSNEDRLKKEGFSPGTFPKEGEPHKPFTFCTRSSFLGVDFYSECAFTFIFADPSQQTLALDISLDILQILGRQRLDSNPYRNEAILFYRENSIGLNDDEYSKHIQEKTDVTKSLIDDFNSTNDPKLRDAKIIRYRKLMVSERFKDDYLMVIDDPDTGRPALESNTLYRLAEIRAWEISKKNYRNECTVIRQQEQHGMTAITGTQSQSPDVLRFKEEFDKTRDTSKRIRLYCDFRQQHSELAEEIDFVSPKYPDYWDALGYEGMKKLGFQESKIKQVLQAPPVFDSTLENVIREVRNLFQEKRYKLDKVKELLGKAYKKYGYQKVAKAKEIEKYLSAKAYQDSKSGKRYYDVISIFQKKITLFPFVWKPNAPTDITIDGFLDIIQKGTYKVGKSKNESRALKDIITEIQSKGDHEEQGRLKREWLPVACINGTFAYKGEHGLSSYSSFVALDYDGFENKESMLKAKEYLKTRPFVYAVFQTPSGLGLKAVILHDSVNPEHHWNLYKQIMTACQLPQTDTGVTDLSRGQFLSWDPDLWKNPNPVPYHFQYDPSLNPDAKPKEKSIAVKGNREHKLDSWISDFLHNLWEHILTDDAILRKLDKHWKEKKPEYFKKGNRHKSMLIMAGTLCKAGVKKDKTRRYLIEKYPDKEEREIESIIDFSYERNPYGSDRRHYG